MKNVMSLLAVRDTTAKGGVTGQHRNRIHYSVSSYRDIYIPTKLKCKLVMEFLRKRGVKEDLLKM